MIIYKPYAINAACCSSLPHQMCRSNYCSNGYNMHPSAKCNSVRKLYANLSDTPVALASASKYFQMLPAPPGALQNALRLCKTIHTCS